MNNLGDCKNIIIKSNDQERLVDTLEMRSLTRFMDKDPELTIHLKCGMKLFDIDDILIKATELSFIKSDRSEGFTFTNARVTSVITFDMDEYEVKMTYSKCINMNLSTNLG